MSSEGINRLAGVFHGHTRKMSEQKSMEQPTIDIGEIQADMSLLTNKFPVPIPQSDYLVCRSVQWGKVDDIFYHTQNIEKDNSGEHVHENNGAHEGHSESDGSHDHSIDNKEMRHIQDTLIGPKFRWLEPKDRVLVAWAGDDACVVDIIYPADRIGRDADGYDK